MINSVHLAEAASHGPATPSDPLLGADMLVPLEDTRLWAMRLGAGPPMFCLHGGLGLDHTCFRPWLDPLAGIVELLYYDHRGNGRSAHPEDWIDVDHRTWTQDIEALRTYFGFDRIILFGHSYGGYFAQEYALTHPDRLLGLILCDTSPATDHGALVLAGITEHASAERSAFVADAFSRPFAGSAQDFRATYRDILPLYFRNATPELLDALVQEMRFSPAAFNRGFIECRPHFDVRDRLGEITAPTLVLAGRHDLIVPLEPGAERLHAGIPGSELVVFEESGHFPFIEEQDRFLETVCSWITAVT